MRRATLTALLACSFLVTACSTVESKSSVGQRMVVFEDATIFYRHMLLRKGVEVKVLKKEFLYSLVELSNGQKGYVANDALSQTTALPQKNTGVVPPKPARKVSKAKKRASLAASSGSNPSDALPKPSFRY